MIKRLQKKYALSEQGARDLIKGCIACVFQNITLYVSRGASVLAGGGSDERRRARRTDRLLRGGLRAVRGADSVLHLSAV